MQLQQHLLHCSSSSFEICSHNIVLSCNSSFVGIGVLLRYLLLVSTVVSAVFFPFSRPFFVVLLLLRQAVASLSLFLFAFLLYCGFVSGILFHSSLCSSIFAVHAKNISLHYVNDKQNNQTGSSCRPYISFL